MAAKPQVIAYLRVSTQRQGASGLGIEAQRKSVSDYCSTHGCKVLAELVEIESGKNCERVELAKALRLSRVHNATLVIAKLDRLSRDAHFLLGLAKAGVDFVAADMPNANRLTIGIMAMVAEEERNAISQRTKAALQAAKARGVRLGGYKGGDGLTVARPLASQRVAALAKSRAEDILPYIHAIRSTGISTLSGIADALSEQAIPKARGGVSWTATDVRNLLAKA